MGFFRVVNENEMDQEKLTQLWDFSKEAKISDGQKVIVPRNNIMLYIRDNKVMDVITEPGGYIYHSGIESDPAMTEYTAIFNEYLTEHPGAFGEKDLVFFYHNGKVTSAEQIRALLAEPDEKAPEPAPVPVPPQEPAPAYTPPPPQPAPIPVQNAGALWNCASCGTQNDRKFCKKCGAPRPQETAAPVSQPSASPAPVYERPVSQPVTNSPAKTVSMWICGECGTINERSFCKNCGASRKADSEVYVPAPAPKDYVPKPSVSANEPAVPKMSGMWICGECGTKNERSFCKNCGASRKENSEVYVPAPDPSAYAPRSSLSSLQTSFTKMSGTWECKRCGTMNERSFCKSCGASRPS